MSLRALEQRGMGRKAAAFSKKNGSFVAFDDSEDPTQGRDLVAIWADTSIACWRSEHLATLMPANVQDLVKPFENPSDTEREAGKDQKAREEEEEERREKEFNE